MTMKTFKNLSREKKKLYRLAYENGLTEWHWVAAQLLLDANGYGSAERYIIAIGKEPNKHLPDEDCDKSCTHGKVVNRGGKPITIKQSIG